MVEFTFEKIAAHVTRIHAISGELLYLVEGNERAAVLDTGSGIGHLKPLIEQLTDKPYIVLLTHGHVDHAMGAPEFNVPVYMNQKDRDILEKHSALGVRKGGLRNTDPAIVEKIEESDYIPAPKDSFLPLEEGDTFDLGGLTIEAFACPGHTPGSMVFLLKEDRILLLGDACNTFTFLWFDYSLSIPEYKQSLLNLKEKVSGTYDRVLLSHGSGDVRKEVLEGVIELCDGILEGAVDNVPYDFMGAEVYIAKAMTPDRERLDGGVGNIVYRPSQK